MWVLQAGKPPGAAGRVNAFHGLVASFYSLKTKKTSSGRSALGGCFGHCRVATGMGIFA